MKGVKAVLQQSKLGDLSIRCGTCIRRCLIPPDRKGFCGNYINTNGILYNIGYGKVSAIESRPIEIKPLFHFWPGSYATTFSGWGCNFLCPWCQNWHLSKVHPPGNGEVMPPETIIRLAIRWGDEGVCASFNEPTIHLEYMLDVFTLAKRRGLYNTMVTNASFTIEALKLLKEAGLDAISADIKGCPETYRRFMGIPNPTEILNVMSEALKLGIHVEAVYLIVTKANDWDYCVEQVIESHLKYLGPDVPLHVNRYYPAYNYHEPPTSISKLLEVYSKARKKGIKYVYIGNVPSNEYLHTRCPKCGKVLIERTHYGVTGYRLTNDGKCPFCGYRIHIKGPWKTSSRLTSWFI